MRIVVALGGNALLERGAPMTVQNQRTNVATACAALAPVARPTPLPAPVTTATFSIRLLQFAREV